MRDAQLKRLWWRRGFLLGLLNMVGVNAISFFFRSRSWDGFVNAAPFHDVAFGFPLTVWDDPLAPGHLYYFSLTINLVLALLISWGVAQIAVHFREPLEQWVQSSSEFARGSSTGFQVSIKTLLILTAFLAVLISMATAWRGTEQSLMILYALGPVLLIAIALAPQHLAWQKRCVIVCFCAAILIASGIWSGAALGMEFDRVLFGIFLCWTPESILAADVIAVGGTVQHAVKKN